MLAWAALPSTPAMPSSHLPQYPQLEPCNGGTSLVRAAQPTATLAWPEMLNVNVYRCDKCAPHNTVSDCSS